MPQPASILTLLKLMFGEAAPTALATGSPRLLAWAQAFEQWLESRKDAGARSLPAHPLLAWKRLIELTQAPPWAITPADIERFRERLLEQGLCPSYVGQNMGWISAFYEACRLSQVDPGCEPSFNPAKGVPRPKVRQNAHTMLLNPQEAQALLDVLKADKSPISRRDYAFFLSRLRLGVSNRLLRELKWGQRPPRPGAAWVEWGTGNAPARRPDEVWGAILGCLEASGRLGPRRPEGMSPQAYIFTPLAKSSLSPGSGLAEEWAEHRCLSGAYQGEILKIYGGIAGIDRERLSLPALRHAAVAAYLESNPSPAEIGAFLGNPNSEQARRHAREIQAIQKRQPDSDFEARLPVSVRSRKPHIFTARESFKHGLYASHRLPPEQVQAIIDEGIVGMKEETDAFEFLLDKLLEWLEEPGLDDRAVLALGEAHMMSTARIAELFDFEKDELSSLSPEDAQAVLTYQEFCKEYALPGGSEPTLANICCWVDDDDPDGAVKDERLVRRIAADRLILRNMKRVALEKTDPLAYASLVQTYGRRCLRLCKLLKKARPASGRIHAWVWKEIEGFLDGVREWWKKQPPIMVPGWTGPIPPPGPPPT